MNLSENEETSGFDKQTGKLWIYPTNYPLRDYQYKIIEAALLNNTLVSLPTGLGKTFIAAVVMYNFYRWYPIGKIIFMAPTRPLVKQQIDACYNVTAIPKDDTAELTGTKVQASRTNVWKDKRVFFVTPQVLQNDLNILKELGGTIKCLVFDEAHKAKGNHAYCQVIRQLQVVNQYFRVLALSATPGNTINDVLEVMRNLLISHIELRTDSSPDVTPYIFEKSLETIVVPLGGKLKQVRDNYIQILDKYTRILVHHRIVTGNCGALTKGKIFMVMKEFQQKNSTARDKSYNEIMRSLNICITLYHGYELLIQHGLRGFLTFFDSKPLLTSNENLRHILEDVQKYLGAFPDLDLLPDGSTPEISASCQFGHPKFYKLREILVSHFNNRTHDNSRVMVFCEYRESVREACAILMREAPLIKPKMFVGQGGITQKQQLQVVKAFRQGNCNTLVSTCIGEEGLDVGEVDLIVCFDIRTKSPLRMIQRMGRTGRKRNGRVVMLVTEGKEEQILKECLTQKNYLANSILTSQELEQGKYSHNPRMFPEELSPKCHKMFITLPKDKTKNNSNLKQMIANMAANPFPLQTTLSQEVTIMNAVNKTNSVPVSVSLWNTDHPSTTEKEMNTIVSKHLNKIRYLQPIGKFGHSSRSEMMVSLLQYADSKKYNIAMTQLPATGVNSKKEIPKVPSFKQGDLRNMLLTSSANQQTRVITQETKDEAINECNNNVIGESWDETDFTEANNCKICEKLFDCTRFKIRHKLFDIGTWIPPDCSILDQIDGENLRKFELSLNSQTTEISISESPEICHDIAMYFEDSCNFDDFPDETFKFKPPENDDMINKLNDPHCSNIGNAQKNNETKNDFNETLQLFHLSDLNDLFVVPDDFHPSRIHDVSAKINCEDTTIYSPLNDLKKIGNDTPPKVKSNERKDEIKVDDSDGDKSPILSSFNRNWFSAKHSSEKRVKSPKLLVDKKHNNSSEDLFTDSDDSILININVENSANFPKKSNNDCNNVEEIKSKTNLEQLFANINDICDLSIFGFDVPLSKTQNIAQTSKDDKCPVENKIEKDCSKIENIIPENIQSDFCDLTFSDSDDDFNTLSKQSMFSKKCDDKSSKNQSQKKKYSQLSITQILNVVNKDDTQKDNKNKKIWDFPVATTQKRMTQSVINKDNTQKNDKNEKIWDFPVATTQKRITQSVINKDDTQKNDKNEKIWNFPVATTQKRMTQILTVINKDDTQKNDKNKKISNFSAATTQKENQPKKRNLLSLKKKTQKNNIPSVQPNRLPDMLKVEYNDSDDDFETRNKAISWIQPNKNQKPASQLNKCKTPPKVVKKVSKLKPKKRLKDCDYIEMEAAIDGGVISDSDSEHSSTDELEASFVNDETEDLANNTQMHAMYLRSISPTLNAGKFKMPICRSRIQDVYSQEVDQEENSYLNDTFCVDEDNEFTQQSQLCDLEIAEMVLKAERRNKKKSRQKRIDGPNPKRRRIIQISSDESD